MTFDATFRNVTMTEEKEVSTGGRISGFSRYKGQKVFVVVLEQEHTEPNTPLNGNITTYGAGIEGGEQEIDYTIKNNTPIATGE